MKKLKIGVIGAGHLGKIHIKLLLQIPQWQVVGFYDKDADLCEKVSEQFGIPAFENIEDLIELVDAIDIVTPTLSHFEYAKLAIDNEKHFFVEKPLTANPEEAEQLLDLIKSNGKKLVGQVGHVERFNSAYWSVKDRISNPLFIEAHRLAQFNPRGTDVSVVLDLMIHDLDIILSCVKSPIIDIQASGVALISKNADIVNARLTFESGCVANVTASRLSIKNMRKLRLFQSDSYISMDFLNKSTEIVRLSDLPDGDLPSFEIKLGDALSNPLNAANSENDKANGTGKKFITFEIPEKQEHNAIEMELTAFALSISDNAKIEVPLEDGYKALDVAYKINAEVERRLLLHVNA